MVRCFSLLSAIAMLVCLGCGSKTEVAQSSQVTSTSVSQSAGANQPSATEIVSQFLDQVRRGGEDSGAGQLLTNKAQSELKRIGRSIQPIGSPDAQFKVTRSEAVPGEEGSALVHSIWTEPDGAGGTSDFQVVWAVEKESAGWRISGLAMELDPEQDPIIIDFENGELMAKMLGVAEQEDSPAANQSQASVPADSATR